MKVKLWFDDWQGAKGESIYSGRHDLSIGLLHSCTVFDGTINLDDETAEEVKAAIKNKAFPIFGIFEVEE